MKKARNVIGLPIICVGSGEQVGTVKDLLLNDEWQVEALLLEAKHWFSDVTCIRLPDVIAIGDDAVTIEHPGVIIRWEDQSQLIAWLSGDRKVKGLPILTVNGQQLGVIEDVYLEPNKGTKVIGYELTEGFISDLKEGRKWLPLPDSVKIGKDAVIVPVDASEALQEIFEPKEE
ncbi:PRC-barrel domain-containing protein [Paenibacillus cremeus]|uniref:Photosystem reaction center subunit H n=1 Tax=Paenibacillus cremeus TaxID=2163881 RepID=A0A559KIJ3_9BACL|nr:PRC-barrel domain-containing protein [Paenibacillus cremeus]TVY11955.1 photosystem reaction center subunit H [Paenibacillus cremeus]